MEKITKRNMYTALVNFANGLGFVFESEDEGTVTITNEQLVAFAENEIALLDKKTVKAKEAAAKKRTEDPLMDIVFDCVSDEYETIADIAVRVAAADGYDEETASVSKVTYRLSQLCKEGRVEKTDVKKDKRTVKAYRRMA